MSYSLYVRFGHRLYRVDPITQGGKFTLRPTNGKPYQFLRATAQQLQDRSLFCLYPIFQMISTSSTQRV